MFGWGIAVFLGLVLIFWDLKPATRARLAGSPMLIHVLVIGSGLLIHGGSAMGAMAAIMSGVFSALFIKSERWRNGYIKKGVFYPGKFRQLDPRSVTA